MKKPTIEFTISPTQTEGGPLASTPANIELKEIVDAQIPKDTPVLENFLTETVQDIDHGQIHTNQLTAQPETISGNLLESSQEGSTLSSIEGYALGEMQPDEGILELSYENGQGTLTIHTKDSNGHKAGDFSYSSQGNESGHESFSYELQTPEGKIQLALQFDISKSELILRDPDLGFVDQEGFLPGQHDALKTFGDLHINFSKAENVAFEFLPLVKQQGLIDANLTTQNMPLYYVISQDGSTLTAYQGANGPVVFEVELFDDGSYEFQLEGFLDRDVPTNLLSDPTFDGLDLTLAYPFDRALGWQKHTSSLLHFPNKTTPENEIEVSQDILTKPGHAYQLSFYSGVSDNEDSSFELYWNDKLIQTIGRDQAWSGYSFGLEGGAESHSQLKIIGHNLDHPLQHYIHSLTLSDMSMEKLPLEFQFHYLDSEQVIEQRAFTVLVSTEPSIVLTQNEPFNIIYEQTLYQSIILNEPTASNNQPLTKLNLETLFESLRIPHEDRLVDVVQLEEAGEKTNVYEVTISDKKSPTNAITIADIQLKFDGGHDGLDVFSKNIIILDL